MTTNTRGSVTSIELSPVAHAALRAISAALRKKFWSWDVRFGGDMRMTIVDFPTDVNLVPPRKWHTKSVRVICYAVQIAGRQALYWVEADVTFSQNLEGWATDSVLIRCQDIYSKSRPIGPMYEALYACHRRKGDRFFHGIGDIDGILPSVHSRPKTKRA